MIASILSMRRRNVWEAADSGVLLWKKCFTWFLPFFALPVCVTAAILLFIPNQSRWLSWLCLWWLKPFFDRLCLQVVSIRFFADSGITKRSPALAKFKRVMKGLPRILFSRLTGDLLWRRFSPFRCSTMPLRLMERLKRKQFAGRKLALAQGGLGFSAFLTCLGLPLELILLGGEYFFVMMINNLFLPDVNILWEIGSEYSGFLFFIAYVFNYILVESLYMCMGFGVYINSRVETEGWDIQLLFRKFSEKLNSSAKMFVLVTGLILLVSFNALNLAADEIAAEPVAYFPPDFITVEQIPYEKIKEIKSSGDFGGHEPSWRISRKNQTEEIPEETEDDYEIPEWLKKLNEILGQALRFIIIAVIAASVIFIIIRLVLYGRSKKLSASGKNTGYSGPLAVKGDPGVFFDRAETFFKQGMIRDAWASCLYGALNAYIIYMDLSFPPDITEYGCFEIVRSRYKTGSPVTEGFSSLVRNWVLLAYGARIPAEGSFEKALEYGRGLKAAASQYAEEDSAREADIA